MSAGHDALHGVLVASGAALRHLLAGHLHGGVALEVVAGQAFDPIAPHVREAGVGRLQVAVAGRALGVARHAHGHLRGLFGLGVAARALEHAVHLVVGGVRLLVAVQAPPDGVVVTSVELASGMGRMARRALGLVRARVGVQRVLHGMASGAATRDGGPRRRGRHVVVDGVTVGALRRIGFRHVHVRDGQMVFVAALARLDPARLRFLRVVGEPDVMARQTRDRVRVGERLELPRGHASMAVRAHGGDTFILLSGRG